MTAIGLALFVAGSFAPALADIHSSGEPRRQRRITSRTVARVGVCMALLGLLVIAVDHFLRTL